MKVCKHGTDHTEFISGIDKDVGLAGTGLNFRRLGSSILQSTDGGCADGNDAAMLTAGAIDGVGRGFRNRIMLAVEFVIFDAINYLSAEKFPDRHGG